MANIWMKVLVDRCNWAGLAYSVWLPGSVGLLGRATRLGYLTACLGYSAAGIIEILNNFETPFCFLRGS
jgi:hypothetical protein